MPDPNRLAYLQEKLATDSAILDVESYSTRAGPGGWRSIKHVMSWGYPIDRENIAECVEYLTIIGRLEADQSDNMRVRIIKENPCPPKCS
jgi:hypothetical protein